MKKPDKINYIFGTIFHFWIKHKKNDTDWPIWIKLVKEPNNKDIY